MENKQAIDVRNNSLGFKAPCQEENRRQLQGNEVFSISDTYDGKSFRKETSVVKFKSATRSTLWKVLLFSQC